MQGTIGREKSGGIPLGAGGNVPAAGTVGDAASRRSDWKEQKGR